jgi:hypothetical protein
MTPAQARSLVAGERRFARVRVQPMELAASMPIRLLARRLGVPHTSAIHYLERVWSWAAAAWDPRGPWGQHVPAAVVDLLFERDGAAAAMARVGLGVAAVVDGHDALRLSHVEGMPGLQVAYSIRSRGAKGAQVTNDRRRANRLGG